MNMDDIILNMWRTAIGRAAKEGKVLNIQGYEDQQGLVWQFRVRLISSEGYRDLVRRSLEQLKSRLESGIGMAECLEGRTTDEFVKTCSQELLESYGRRQTAPETPTTHNNPLRDSGEGYFESDAKPNQLVLFNLQVLERSVVSGPVAEASKTANKTEVKKVIESDLALGSYIGRLNLEPGRVRSVTVEP